MQIQPGGPTCQLGGWGRIMTKLVQPETEPEELTKSSRSTRRVSFFARWRKRRGREQEERALAERRKSLGDGSGRLKSMAEGRVVPRRIDEEARRELAAIQDRRDFLRKSAIGAGILALGAGLGYGSGYAQGTGLSGGTRTVITDSEIAARVIGGVRIATEFIPDPVPAGTDADPYPGSAIQAALDDGLAVYIPSGTWRLSAPIARAVDNVSILGAGKSTRIVFDGVTPCITAGTQTGWLVANLATDGGGIDLANSSQSRLTEIWIDGVLTDNRPIGTGGGGGGGYYGVRAEDFATSGDGSSANPYNASAIQSAIDALPGIGGIVFIKEGIWRGTTRIRLPQSSTGKTWKKVILQGAGHAPSIYQIDGSPNYGARVGTQIQAGLDMYTPCDLYDLTVSPHPNNWRTQPSIKVIIDPTTIWDVDAWTGGFSWKQVTVHGGDPGIWFTGQNMGTNVWQIFNGVMERIFVTGCKRGMKFDRGDSTGGGSNGFITMRDIKLTHNSGTGFGRVFDWTLDNTLGVWENFLVEGNSDAVADYAIYIDTYGSGGFEIRNWTDGDGNYAAKDAYIRIGRLGAVRFFRHSKDVDIGPSRGYFQIGRKSTSTGNVNVLTGSEYVTLEEMPDHVLSIGTVTGDKARIRIKKAPGNQLGYLGTTTPAGSPYTYTNLDMYDEVVYLVGGTISDVSRGGQSLGTERKHFLAPGDNIVITYSSAPSIKRFGI